MWAFISPLPCKTPTSTALCAMPLFLLCLRHSLSRSRLPRSTPLVVLPRFSRPSCVHPFLSPVSISGSRGFFPPPAARCRPLAFSPRASLSSACCKLLGGSSPCTRRFYATPPLTGEGGGGCVRPTGREGQRGERYRRERQRETEREACVHGYVRAPVYVSDEDTGAVARWWESWRRRTALLKRVRGAAEAGVAASRRIRRTMQVGERTS